MSSSDFYYRNNDVTGEPELVPQNQLHDKDYSDGRAKQAFKDSCDINRILHRAGVANTMSHLDRFGGEYGDFSGLDFFETQVTLARGQQIFEQLPAEVRREFRGEPGHFFEYVNDPANADRLAELLPGLAEPGVVLPSPGRGRTDPADPQTHGPTLGRENPQLAPEGSAQTPPAADPSGTNEPPQAGEGSD